ncbi:DUF5690 family protein [Flavihumibacter petaseus]|nr:DUF5690 family protein [Flavihumibacter petaseus]
MPNTSDISAGGTSRSVVWLAAVACFSTYFCMYGFRKAISAGTWDHLQAFGISFKSALVIAQVLGYMTSKFLGIRFIANLNPNRRAMNILLLILSAHLCLLLMALVPLPWNTLFLFGNGLCLGLIWGLVFSYIEGRRYTDMVALVLSINFIFSSGAVKSVGLLAMKNLGISEMMMPFVTGCFFLPLLFISVYLLSRIPAATPEEIQQRGERPALDGRNRMAILQTFLPGLFAVIVMNLLLTILRDVKDNFAVEIVRQVRPDASALLFTRMETVAAIAVFFALLTLAGIGNHFKSLQRQHLAIALGFLTILLVAFFLHERIGDPIALMITYTVGLYISYNCIQCLFLERFIAAYKVKGNIGFFFYLMDSIGYLGSCILILYKELFNPQLNWFPYFVGLSLIFGGVGLISVLGSWRYFSHKKLHHAL